MDQKQYTTPLTLLALVGELGIIIALPLIILVVLGIWIDRVLGMPHVFLVVGMVIAALISSVIILNKAVKAARKAGM